MKTSLRTWSKVLLENLIVIQLVKKFPTLYGTWKFITVLARSRHLSLSWARCIQSTPSYHISLRATLILLSYLSQDLPDGCISFTFYNQNIVYIFHRSRATCPAHIIILDMINLIISGEAYKLWSYSFCRLVYRSATASFLSPNIHLSIFFANALNLWSSVSTRDEVSHPYKTTCKIMKVKGKVVLCFNWAPRHEGVLGKWRYSSAHSLSSALDGGE
jgi:hypothetical protein